MDHNEAVTKKMAESCLLEELTPEQRDAFEEHYFDCPECAKDVKAAAMLVANVKEVLRTEPAFRLVFMAATGLRAGGGSGAGRRSLSEPGYHSGLEGAGERQCTAGADDFLSYCGFAWSKNC
ncbi:MAG: hypothetical protein DMG67_06760 [Acidobacteria bacterium]|nr:MAG: hypothetical protein DMG67_06760 [Acidobacteriota bacterium]